jgi:hypothetical protein
LKDLIFATNQQLSSTDAIKFARSRIGSPEVGKLPNSTGPVPHWTPLDEYLLCIALAASMVIDNDVKS